ncbi:MAG TPA: type II toxin-antitoxin system HicB family antitoxin [bacterium]|nr:type II toxin-antitoxin system HicB family antitoxin [bacterium]
MDQKTYQYTVVYEMDEDGVYIADVPALPGCHSFGDTIEEAERNIQEAITGYLEVLRKLGKPIPEDPEISFIIKKTTQINLPA